MAYSPSLNNAITITNTGKVDWSISRITLGDSEGVFSFWENEAEFITDESGEYVWGTYCGNPAEINASSPVNLAPGESCFVAVSFLPKSETTYTARLRCYDQISRTVVFTEILTGTGVFSGSTDTDGDTDGDTDFDGDMETCLSE